MAAWITITVDDLRDTKASDLIDAFQTAALGDGQTDPVPRKINSVCDHIRTQIEGSGKYEISLTPHAIPPSLFDLAARLIAWQMQSRLNVGAGDGKGTMPPSDQDVIDHRDDINYLREIRRGEVPIEEPDDPDTTPNVSTGAALAESVGDRPRQVTRESMASF